MAGIALSIAAGSGRGDNPSTVEGILIVVGIVVTVAVLGFVGHLLLHKFGRTRPETQERRPHRRGRVGRL